MNKMHQNAPTIPKGYVHEPKEIKVIDIKPTNKKGIKKEIKNMCFRRFIKCLI